MTEWLPMSSAPKDGTLILAYYSADAGIYHVLWNDKDDYPGWISHDWEITNFEQSDFTHWMPAPLSPMALDVALALYRAIIEIPRNQTNQEIKQQTLGIIQKFMPKFQRHIGFASEPKP